jgi:hypothetical protein
MCELDSKLDAILEGELRPADAGEARDLARLCSFRGRHAEAAFFLREALNVSTGTAGGQDLIEIEAAEAALRAGGPEWRARALAWLEKALLLLREERNVWWLGQLKHRLDMACVREEESLAELPPEEREAWRAFWKRVDEALEHARAGR